MVVKKRERERENETKKTSYWEERSHIRTFALGSLGAETQQPCRCPFPMVSSYSYSSTVSSPILRFEHSTEQLESPTRFDQ